MSLTLIQDTDFSGLADWLESPGDPAGQPVDGTEYINPAGYSNGNNWRITSGHLCGNGFSDTSKWCGLPAATYHARSGRYVAKLTNAGSLPYIILVKVNGTKAYAVDVEDLTGSIGKVRVQVGPIDTDTSGFVANAGSDITTAKTGMTAMWAVVDFSEPDTSHTTVSATVYDDADVASFNASTGVITLNGGASAIGTVTLTNDATAGYQNVDAGFAVTSNSNGTGFARLAAYSDSVAPSMTVIVPLSSLPIQGNRQHNAVILTGTATAWTSSTTFSLAGVSGVSIESQHVDVSEQVAALNVATGTATGTVTVSNNTDAATTTFEVAPVLLHPIPSLASAIPVSCRSSIPLSVLASPFASPGVMSQDRFPIVSDCTAIQLVYANDTATAFDLRAAVKVGISGTLHRITFTDPTSGTTGITQITLPPYSRRISEPLTLAVAASTVTEYGNPTSPENAGNLFVRTWIPLAGTQTINCTRIIQGNASPGANHDGFYATGTDDTLDAGADASLTNFGARYGPSLILGAAADMNIAFVPFYGDSILQDAVGNGHYHSACMDLGVSDLNCALQATTAQQLINAGGTLGDRRSTALLTSWMEWATNVVCQHSHNTISGMTAQSESTVRGLLSDLRTIRGMIPTACTYQVTTGTPYTSLLSGSWTTVTEAEQATASGSYNTQQFNEFLRSGGPGPPVSDSFIDLAADAETTPSSMKWAAGDLTGDGTHPAGGLTVPWKARFIAELTPTQRNAGGGGGANRIIVLY